MFAILKWLTVAFITLLLAMFAVVNRHFVIIQFYPLPFEMEIPVYLLIIVLFFAGFTTAWFLSRMAIVRLRLNMRQKDHHAEALKEEVMRLRHQPASLVEKS